MSRTVGVSYLPWMFKDHDMFVREVLGRDGFRRLSVHTHIYMRYEGNFEAFYDLTCVLCTCQRRVGYCSENTELLLLSLISPLYCLYCKPKTICVLQYK